MSWTRSLVGAAGIAAASSTPARAENGWTTDAGLYLAYHFGAGAPGHVALGIEARRTYGELELGCGNTVRHVGALGRIELVGWDQVRLAVGPSVLRTNFYTEVAADVSLGLRLGRDPGFHAEPGLEGAVLTLMRARMAYAITRQFSAGGGLRIPRFAQGCAVEGRPLRREGGRALLPEAVLVGEPPPSSDAEARAMGIWAGRASAEWASAPAFCELGEQLSACGAPGPLVEAARAAAEDEVRHAVIAASVTATLGGRTVSIEPPALDRRSAVAGAAGLCRLAVESWVDGCLGEATAAASLAAEAELARSPELREAQRAIAADEARHAQLAWDVLAWTLSVGGADLRCSLDRAVADRPPPGPGPTDADLAHLGCLPPEQRRQIALVVQQAAENRLETLKRT